MTKWGIDLTSDKLCEGWTKQAIRHLKDGLSEGQSKLSSKTSEGYLNCQVKDNLRDKLGEQYTNWTLVDSWIE